MKRAAAPFQPFRTGMSADGRNPLPVQIGARGARLPPLRAPFLPVPSSVFLPLRPAASGSAACLPLLFRAVRGVRFHPAPSICAYPFFGRALSMSFCPAPCCIGLRGLLAALVPCLFGCDFSESPSSGPVSGRGFGGGLLRSRGGGRKDGFAGIAPISCTYSTLRPAVPASAPAH